MKKIILLFSVLFLVLLSACRTEVTETLISNDYTMENTEFSETVSEPVYPSYDVIVPESSFVTPTPPAPVPFNYIVSSETEKTWGVPYYPFEVKDEGNKREPGVTGTEVSYSVATAFDEKSPGNFPQYGSFRILFVSSVKDMEALCRDYAISKYPPQYNQKFFEEKTVLFAPLLRTQSGFIMENTEIYSIVKNGNEICVNFATNLVPPPNHDYHSQSGFEITMNKSDIKGITQYRYNYIVLSQEFPIPFSQSPSLP